jgi:hypothetical protein
VPGFAGATTFEINLNIFFAELHARRTAINNAAHGRTMTLAKGRDRE